MGVGRLYKGQGGVSLIYSETENHRVNKNIL